MPKCVAAGCSNSHANKVSIHQFPKDEFLRKKWAAAVSKTRLNFQGSVHSVLCSEHFAADDFEPRSLLATSFGVSGRNLKRLKKGVIPTVFKKPVRPGQLIGNEKKQWRSTAYEKRKQSGVLLWAMQEDEDCKWMPVLS
ncbi:THAP domain-containing protein 10-like isoform X2 [Anneissia japonica]|uniref:THAP domain-containing protein 10-like isoform X2 n=1 Tax=Anneissia japonica TaxID=1529436 RepID=UPI0014256569|nr:THAP domain-containing protein 10-like isoform X2 [Anneissia japonica]